MTNTITKKKPSEFNKKLREILRKFGENDMNSLLICDDVDDLISQINKLVRKEVEKDIYWTDRKQKFDLKLFLDEIKKD